MSRNHRIVLYYGRPSVSSPQKSPPLSILHVGRALSEAKSRNKSDEEYEVRYVDGRYEELTQEDLLWCDSLGVSSMTGYQLKSAIWAMKEAKRYGKRTILGGIHCSMQPDQCLAEDYVDSVVLSEGEWGVIQAIHGGHKQRVHSHLGGTQDHVSPVSPETLIHFKRSAKTGDSVLMTSRGCPFRCGFCLDGDTLVLKSDMSWAKIKELKIGDKVVGLDKVEYGHNLEISDVLATSKREANAFEIITDRGSVIATSDHRWLIHANHSRWRRTGSLKSGDRIRFVTPVTERFETTKEYQTGYLAGASVGDGHIGHYKYGNVPEQHHYGLVGDSEMMATSLEYAKDVGINLTVGNFNSTAYKNLTKIVRTHKKNDVSKIENLISINDATIEYKRGFLAGFFDADGSATESIIRLYNNDDSVLERIEEYLKEFNFEYQREYSGNCPCVRIKGGRSENLRFYSIFKPKVEHRVKIFGNSLGNDYAEIKEIKPLGKREVYDIETTTHNFVANGLVSHNCYIQEFFNRSWQPVDMDRWKHDVLYLKENAGVVKYEHGDDWIGKWSRASEIIKFLWDNDIEYRPSIRAHQITDEVAREMAGMGIRHISVGMETASERMLVLTQKDITKQHQYMCAEALAKNGIHPLFYWITGFPTETPSEINETLDVADDIHKIFKKYKTPLTQNFYAYTALPGSPLFDLVDKDVLPKSMEEWSNYSLNKTYNKQASNLYHIGGLHFHKEKGDKTDRNFPGAYRLLISPFENLASIRWGLRYFDKFELEYWFIERLLKWASLRYENKINKTKLKLKDVDIADWGVKENEIGARGEFMTGEIGKDNGKARYNDVSK